jgi:hypothetical protein
MLPVWKHLFQRKGYKKGDKSKILGFFSGSLGEVWVLRSMMIFQLHMVLYQLPIMWQEIMIFLNGKHLCNFPSMKGTSGVTHRIWDPLHIHGIPCKMCEERSNSPLNCGNGNRNLLTSINPYQGLLTLESHTCGSPWPGNLGMDKAGRQRDQGGSTAPPNEQQGMGSSNKSFNYEVCSHWLCTCSIL